MEEKPCKHGHPAFDRYRTKNGTLRCRSCDYLTSKKVGEKKNLDRRYKRARDKEQERTRWHLGW